MDFLTEKITFLMTNKKIRNLLIIVIVAFSIVGALRYLDLYEGYAGQNIAPEQTSEKSLMEDIDKTTKDTNKKVSEINEKVDKMNKESNIEIQKEQI